MGFEWVLSTSITQATISLYFADDELSLFSPDTATLSTFMGVDEPGQGALRSMDGGALDAVWRPTPWPGVRLIPAGADIQNGDIGLYLISRSGAPVYRVLRDAIERWSDEHPPRTQPEDLRDEAGRFDAARFEVALTETVDVIVIDQQPSLTLMQLNGLIAADCVVIPRTMKGFDLATLATFISSIVDYLDFITAYEDDLEIGRGRHVVLPTIVQEANDRDTEAIVDLYRRAPRDVLQVWYAWSDAIANAAERYMSIYEYDPPKSRQASARAFTSNANAVLVERTLPHLDTRGYAQLFVDDRWS